MVNLFCVTSGNNINFTTMNRLFVCLIFFACFAVDESFANADGQKGINSDTIFANISVTQARDTITAHADDPWFVILDVRTPSEYSTKHLEEGVNMDYYASTFATALATLNRGKTYLIHCAGGSRSALVYTMMQNLHFARVYNMLGGINSWSSASYSYPTVTTTAPVLGALSDTTVMFNNTTAGLSDSVLLTITNCANDVLTFSQITDLTGTGFSTGFDLNTTLNGAGDYSFYISYLPPDTIPDSTVFTVFSNGGQVNFHLSGTPVITSGLKTGYAGSFAIYDNFREGKIQVSFSEHQSGTMIYLYDLNGQVMAGIEVSGFSALIDYTALQNGIYLLKVTDSKSSRSVRLPLLSR